MAAPTTNATIQSWYQKLAEPQVARVTSIRQEIAQTFNKDNMAEPYLERLSQIVARIEPLSTGNLALETKHFFSGAALYANGKICASLSPAGFALKLPAEVRSSLIEEGRGKEFRFFPKGPLKREYVALSDSLIQDDEQLRKLVSLSASFASA